MGLHLEIVLEQQQTRF